MRPIDGDALEKDLRESHDQLREIYNGLKYDDDRQICAGQLTTFIEAILRIKDAPTIDQYGTWIPCSERLPKCNGRYLVWRPHYYGRDRGGANVCYFDGQNTWHDADGVDFTRTLNKGDVIAWMPLPEPYGEE